jgi:tape measure domain-containing protein
VTLAISTQNAERDIKRAFDSANPEGAGRRAGERFSESVGGGMQSKMASVGAVGAKALGGALTLGVAAAATTITGTLGAALSKGFDRLVSIDDAKFKLKALGNSAADVQDIMDSALESVQGTAFGMGEAATIAASAVAAGVQPGKELTSYLKLTADAAAVAGTSLQDMGMIINQVRTGQVAYTEDLEQLAGRGIPIWQWLGEAMKVPAAEVKKLASEGKVSSEIFERAIRDNIGGAALAMGESFSGSVKNAQAALGRLGAALLAPAFSQAPGGISAITSALKGMEDWVKANQSTIISFWEGIGQAAITSAQMTLGAVANLTSAFGNLVGGLGNIQGVMLKIQATAADFRGDGEEAARLREESEAAFGLGEGLKEAAVGMMETAQGMDSAKDKISAFGDAARSNAAVLAQLGDDASKSTDRIRDAFNQLPKDVPINIATPGAEEVFQILTDLNQKVRLDNDKNIAVDAPLAPEVLQLLESLNIKVREDNGKLITVKQEGAEEAGQEIDAAANKERTASITVIAKYGPGILDNPEIQNQFRDDFRTAFGAPVTPRAEGAIVPQSGLRFIDKPDQADIYDGAGAGTIFAEEETGGEAYIPLAPGKRTRSTAILAEVARLFGLNLSAPTGSSGASLSTGGGSGDLVSSLATAVTAPIVNALDQIRNALSSSSSPRYSRSSPLAVDAGFDSALLSMVPSGTYSQTQAADLTQGLADCSSAVEDLVNMMDGMPTAGREMATGNAAEWLMSRGFMPTDTPMPGTFQVGFNNSHMEATLPEGTAFNWGGAESAASGGVAGATGAWASGFTQQFYRPVTGAMNTLAETSQELNTALSKRITAETDLTTVVADQADAVNTVTAAATETSTTPQQGQDFSSLGQSLFSGVLQGIGLDGSVFSNPFEWANVKSGMALANWGGGLLQKLAGGSENEGSPSTDTAGGGLGLPGLPNIADFIKPLPDGTITPQPDAPHQGGGQAPGPSGPSVVVNGNLGVNPRDFTQRIDAHQNQAYRRNINAVRPS